MFCIVKEQERQILIFLILIMQCLPQEMPMSIYISPQHESYMFGTLA